MPEFYSFAVLAVVVALAGIWVFIDARMRLAHRPPWEPFLWALGTALPYTFPIFFPMYLLGARAPDRSGIWGPGEMIGIAVFFSVTMPLVASVMGILDRPLDLRALSLLVLAQNGGFILLSVLGVAVRYGLPLARLGLTARKWALMLVLGAIVGAVMIPVSSEASKAGVELVALVKGREAALRQAERERAMDPLNRLITATRGTGPTAWLVLLLGVAVPLGEEVYFRGVVYGGLRRRYGIGWGLVGSTLFFGVVHRQIVHFLPIAVLGLTLALLYERTQSLLPPVAVHAVNNITAILSRLYGWEI